MYYSTSKILHSQQKLLLLNNFWISWYFFGFPDFFGSYNNILPYCYCCYKFWKSKLNQTWNSSFIPLQIQLLNTLSERYQVHHPKSPSAVAVGPSLFLLMLKNLWSKRPGLLMCKFEKPLVWKHGLLMCKFEKAFVQTWFTAVHVQVFHLNMVGHHISNSFQWQWSIYCFIGY